MKKHHHSVILMCIMKCCRSVSTGTLLVKDQSPIKVFACWMAFSQDVDRMIKPCPSGLGSQHHDAASLAHLTESPTNVDVVAVRQASHPSPSGQ
jgi:hypothetical protein